MKPHQTIVSIRLKTHEVNENGECVPPSVEDTGTLLFSIKGITRNDIKVKTEEFLKKVKEWLNQ